MNGRFSIATLGCKVNQIDSAAIREILENAGMRKTETGEVSELVVINTCTVTARTDRQVRQLVARSRKDNPEALIVVTGCAPLTGARPEIYEQANLICGNLEKNDLLKLVETVRSTGERMVSVAPMESAGDFFGPDSTEQIGRSRAFCKIQDGCSFACTYCIVPPVRGPSRSLDETQVVQQIERLADAGFREIVLTGIHLGTWGLDLKPKRGFTGLLDRLTREFPKNRFRLSSIEPREIDDELIELMARRDNFCEHLHIPLQSGSDAILSAMNRNYDARFYRERIEKVAREIPDVTLGADVITGFPGESEELFEETVSFIRETPLVHLHVFPFSRRPGTKADRMENQIPGDILKKRAAILRDLGREKRINHYQRFVGRLFPVLSEGEKTDGYCGGTSSNYIPVLFETSVPAGTVAKVRIDRLLDKATPVLIGVVESRD
jgi:threonylcarbamoyladenosine tRNA methylthiotransferase MtaB